MPSATAILDRFLHHAEVLTFNGKSYRLRKQAGVADAAEERSKPAKAPAGTAAKNQRRPAAPSPAGNPELADATTCQA